MSQPVPDTVDITLETLLDRPALRGALLYRAQHGDHDAEALLLQHDAGWAAVASEYIPPDAA